MRTNLLVLSELQVEHIALEIELAERPVLDVVPQNEAVAGIAGVIARSYESNDVGPKQHLSELDTAIEVYKRVSKFSGGNGMLHGSLRPIGSRPAHLPLKKVLWNS